VTGRPPDAGRLPARLRAHLVDTGLIEPGADVLVALSGGLDSVVLLHLLRFPLRGLVGVLEAAHLDHAMRPDSAADARWVRGLCRAWRVPLHVGRLDPPAASEADARARRYAFLEEAARPGVSVATGHQRDDQAETVLFRAIRGTGLRGLRGIAPRRGAVVRPLLPFRRRELEVYAEAVGLAARTDPSNADPGYARNRLRGEVIPALERIRPGAAESLARLADGARAWEAAWDAALERLEGEVVVRVEAGGIVLARPVLRSYPTALRARLLRRLLRRYGSSPDRAGTQAALEFISSGRSGAALDMAGGVRLERDFDELRVRTGSEDPDLDRPLRITGPAPGTGRARIGGRWIRVSWGRESRGGGMRARVAAPVFPLTVRGWKPGDRIRLPYGSKKLKKLFGERRLDRRARRRAVVLEDGDGRIVWVAGVARADGVGEDGVGFDIVVENAG
jgi:tRNA(Ile)-lysidine synthase